MAEIHAARLASVDPGTSISDYLIRHGTQSPATTLYREKVGDVWVDWSAAKTLEVVRGLAKGLKAAGYGAGDSIAIMSHTRLEWTLADLAIWHVGAVPVPVYETSSASQTQWILIDAGCVAAFVEDDALADVVAGARAEGDGHGVRDVWVFDNDDLGRLRERGSDLTDAEADDAVAGVGLDDVATIIYTSGTTGLPKGVELTHGNFVELSEETIALLPDVVREPGASLLLFLPLAHIFARVMEVIMLITPVPMGHTETKRAVADLASFRPSMIVGVPRVWEKIYTSAELKTGKGLKKAIFRWASRVAVVYSRSLESPGRASRAVTLQHRLADALVYSKLRAVLGGNLHYMFSAGAPLGERLGNFYRGIGVHMLEGYGLTETTAQTTLSTLAHTRMGTVGRCMPGTSFRIAEDGEVLVKGVGVFRGYHNNPAATAEAIQDGWFHTGDLGSFDADGYLSITGRKKELIVTASGKNVAPALLEDPLRAHPLISQVVAVGDNRPFIAALITLDADVLPAWLANHDRPPLTVEQAATDPFVREHIQAAVDRVNQRFSRSESIREIRILPEDFTLENDLLTPTFKVKRQDVLVTHKDLIDSIYA